MGDNDTNSPAPNFDSPNDESKKCEAGTTSCCGPSQSNDHNDSERTDGAGEPCPTPLMWQEVRENFRQQSNKWETFREPHRLMGRDLGNGPPLYFCTNLVATAELYSLLIWLLQDRFRCVAFDTVTNDRSSARRSKPTMKDFAEDLFVVADKVGDERFSVYGAGFGAAVAIQAALEHPERIDRLFLQHGFASRRLSFFERLLTSFCLLSGRTLDDLPQRRRFQAVNHRPWFPPFDQSRFDFLIKSTGHLPLRDLARRALAVMTFDVSARLGEIKCPVTLIRTEGEGRMAEQSQQLLEKSLPRAQVEWLHSSGQHPYLTHPHRVAKIIEKHCLTEIH